MAQKAIIMFLALILGAAAAEAATYYVSTTGSDSNPGTEASPWAHCPGMTGWTGTATLAAGDTVYFRNTDNWSGSPGQYSQLLSLAGGVTYDGSSWGTGTKAGLICTGPVKSNLVHVSKTDPSLPTTLSGFVLNLSSGCTGYAVNLNAEGDLLGAAKKIQDCIVDGSNQTVDSDVYCIVISSGYGGLTTSNVEILDNTVLGCMRDGIYVYAGNEVADDHVINVTVRGNEAYGNARSASSSGSGIKMKNHVVDAVIEYNYVHDNIGAGLAIDGSSGVTAGPENFTIRYNLFMNAETGKWSSGLPIASNNNNMTVSGSIYGNIFWNPLLSSGIYLTPSAGSLPITLKIYNNIIHGGTGKAYYNAANTQNLAVDLENNILLNTGGDVVLRDAYCNVSTHESNIYYRPGGGNLVTIGAAAYTSSNLASWESTAYSSDPLFKNSGNLPTGYNGTYGLDMEPDADGLSISSGDAIDHGQDLGAAFSGAINLAAKSGGLSRPQGSGWDIGAYEYVTGGTTTTTSTTTSTTTTSITTTSSTTTTTLAGSHSYYVSSSGSDSDPGTQESPWAHCPGMKGWTGSATLAAGDTVYFRNSDTWAGGSIPNADGFLELAGGVTYDGESWGSGSKATITGTSTYSYSNLVSMNDDDAVYPTVFKGFMVLPSGTATAIAVDYPYDFTDLVGAAKRIQDCVVDGINQSDPGDVQYCITSQPYGGHTVQNLEILDNVVRNCQRDGIYIYPGNEALLDLITDVVVRGNDLYSNGRASSSTGSCIKMKNHVKNALIEYNYIHDCLGAGFTIDANSLVHEGAENATIRYNLVVNCSSRSGQWNSAIAMFGDGHPSISASIYGNIFWNPDFTSGMYLSSSLSGGAVVLDIYNNVIHGGSGPTFLCYASNPLIQIDLENNVLLNDGGNVLVYDIDGYITTHKSNIYYRPGGGTLVSSSSGSITSSNLASWEPTAYSTSPGFKNSGNLPTGYNGTYGLDMEPDADGLSISSGDAIDHGQDLGAAFSGAINLAAKSGGLSRPQGSGWDIGAYEYVTGGATTTTTSTTTSTSSTSTSSSSTTSTTTASCSLAGDYPPCGIVSLEEVIDAINQWVMDQLSLGEVVDLINMWAST